MRTLSRIVIIASLAISLPAYAIQVKVVSNNEDLEGIGFSHNGEDYGGMGSEYTKSGLPKGKYSFGVRLYGKDISCKDKNGNKQITLTRSTSVALILKGNRCTAKVSS